MTTKLPSTVPAFLWHFLRRQPWAFTFIFLVPMSIVLEANVMPYAFKQLMDAVATHSHDKVALVPLVASSLWLGGLAMLTWFTLVRCSDWLQCTVVPKFEAQIRLATLEYTLQHSHRYFADQLSGKLANQISDLPRALNSIRTILCWNIVAPASIVLAGLVMMANIRPIFAWFLFVWVAVQVAFAWYMAKRVGVRSHVHADQKSELNGHVVDTLSNMTTVRLFARRTYEQKWIGQSQAKEQVLNQDMMKSMSWMRFVLHSCELVALAAVIFFLIQGWQQGVVTAGDFLFVFNVVWILCFHLWMLSESLTNLFRDIGIARQALMLLNVPHELRDAPQAQPLQVTAGEIVFEQVDFHYRHEHAIFDNKNVVIQAGQKVGLVGFSGSGKTTFAHLILRFYDLTAGRILIDGQDIAQVTQASLHESIAMIPQDTSLFHRSLMENIRYARLDASDEEVMQAARLAHCDEFIEHLPQGYHTLVGERGVKLSGGQRQRIAIARAFLKNAPILILDEATSALDSVTERHIQAGLHDLMQGRTTIVIAHRLSTLSEMDRVLVFDQGRVVEDGNHASLLAQQGHYAKLWRMQAGGFLPEEEADHDSV